MCLKTFIILFIILCSVNCFGGLPTAKLTVRVVDTKGRPIVGAYSFANFYRNAKSNIVRGETDKNGIFSATGKTIGVCGITVRKEGYYTSGGASCEGLKRGGKIFFNRWEPWDRIDTVVLKDIRNPIQMYAKGTDHIDIPILEQPVGYDLERGDWVTPYGKGVTNDFLFYFKLSDINAKPYHDNWQISYSLTFPNEKDGIQEYYPDDSNRRSGYIWPYKAPETGYQSRIEGFSLKKNGRFKKTFDKNKNYIFRIRTIVDKEGKIINARYGKIKGDFRIGLGEDSFGTIEFTYYFNPTGNKNLEYDTKNPLFTFPRNKSGTMGYRVSSP